jgi:hypothetical protein
VADLDRVLRLDPHRVVSLIDRGAGYNWLKKYSLAVSDTTLAIQLCGPGWSEAKARALEGRAISKTYLRKWKECEKDLTEILKRDSPGLRKVKAFYSRARVRLNLNEKAGAVRDVEAAKKLDRELRRIVVRR